MKSIDKCNMYNYCYSKMLLFFFYGSSTVGSAQEAGDSPFSLGFYNVLGKGG